MLDRVKFKGLIRPDEIPHIVEAFHLQECTEEGVLFWKSSEYGKFDGMNMRIKDGRIEINCSIHKMHTKMAGGKLDNSGGCTMGQALETVRSLFDELKIDESTVRVPYFEIGLSLPMQHEPLEYIHLVTGIGAEKEMFIDANYQRDRQKTTQKTKHHRKVFKIYDKTWEAMDRGRSGTPDNILRIETMYKRQGAHLMELYDPEWSDAMLIKFYKDWSTLRFVRNVKAPPGTRASQVERARDILTMGEEAYREHITSQLHDGLITEKQARTCREFLRDWPHEKDKYRQPEGEMEKEFISMLNIEFQQNRIGYFGDAHFGIITKD